MDKQRFINNFINLYNGHTTVYTNNEKIEVKDVTVNDLKHENGIKCNKISKSLYNSLDSLASELYDYIRDTKQKILNIRYRNDKLFSFYEMIDMLFINDNLVFINKDNIKIWYNGDCLVRDPHGITVYITEKNVKEKYKLAE